MLNKLHCQKSLKTFSAGLMKVSVVGLVALLIPAITYASETDANGVHHR